MLYSFRLFYNFRTIGMDTYISIPCSQENSIQLGQTCLLYTCICFGRNVATLMLFW